MSFFEDRKKRKQLKNLLNGYDFDFVLGSDGVKILLPTKGLDAKFFMYYLNSCKIPSLGYSRHYKLLKTLSTMPRQ